MSETKYRIKDSDEIFDWEDDAYDYVEEWLDNDQAPIEIAGETFDAGNVLRTMDENAFQRVYYDMIQEEEWTLISDDVNGFAHQIDKVLEFLKVNNEDGLEAFLEEFPTKDYPIVNDRAYLSDMADFIEQDISYHTPDDMITWQEGYVWHIEVTSS